MNNFCEQLKMPERGVSLYFAVIITAILLAVVLGLTTIVTSQLKMISGIGDSVIAFFTADSGMEKILYFDKECRQSNCTTTWPGLCTEQCEGFATGYYSTSSQWNDKKYEASASTTQESIIFKSLGTYKSKTRRAIESQRKR